MFEDQLNDHFSLDSNSWDKVLEHTNRRDLLGRRMNEQKLECPSCGTRQVQLVSYINTTPALWKCRKCREQFEWEGV
ncbi:hypothetical protein [Vibrio phage RYC]|nr:hypothetical protein [Vibrio phage RYC]